MSGRRKGRGRHQIAAQSHIAAAQIKGGDGQTSVTVSKFTAGPLPSADELRGYGEVIPGLDQRIAESFFSETEHRRELEKREMAMYERAVKADYANQRVGLALQGLMWANLFGIAWYGLTNDVPAATVTAILTVLAQIVSTVYAGKRAKPPK